MLDPRGNYTLLMPSNSSSENTRFDSPYSKSTHKYAANHFWQQLKFGIFHFSGILPSNLKNFCSTIFNKFSRISAPTFLLLIGLFFLSLILIFYLFFSPLNDLDKNCYELKSSEEIAFKEMETTFTGPQFFKKRIVHLDLKGAAPRPEYLAELFPLFGRLNFNAILMEYEDMFPYSGELTKFARKTAYNVSTIEWINQMAASNGLELIPLVQTFGHMEFALKHAEFASLREVPIYTDTICPSSDQSISLIRKMINQIRSLHPNPKSIHIGCDEAWHVGQDERCQHRLNTTLGGSLERLKMEHISKIARIAGEEFGFSQVYAWNDMFDKTKVELLREYNLGKLLIPVIWGYNRDVTQPGYFPGGLLERYSKVFDDLQFASAFKGANGVTQQFIDIQRYMENLISYRQLYHQNKTLLDGRLSGIVLTGWQRFNHNRPLCELLPLGIPVMVKQAFYIADWDKQDPEDNSKLKAFLKCSKKYSIVEENEFKEYKGKKFPIILETEMRLCQFPGVDLYREIENVRYLLWKYWSAKEPKSNQSQNIDEEEMNKIELEYQKLRKNKIAPTLAKYFFEDTVAEWMEQHKRLDDFQSDSVEMPRFDPI